MGKAEVGCWIYVGAEPGAGTGGLPILDCRIEGGPEACSLRSEACFRLVNNFQFFRLAEGAEDGGMEDRGVAS
jgi:hypothetical protein